MNLSSRFLAIAVVYLMSGSVFGMVMGITHNFLEAPVHAHIVLLGWASLALMGIIYRVYTEMAQKRLATAHFWLHNLGLPVMMVGQFLMLRGETSAQPIVATGAVAVLLGIFCFVVNTMRSLLRAA